MSTGTGSGIAALGASESAPSTTSVVDFVALARRRRSLHTALESTALGAAAAAIAVAAALLSLAPAGRGEMDLAALSSCGALSGLAAAGTWWVERAKKTDLELARQIDSRLNCEYALSTAYEACLRGERGAGARWLERRVNAGLDRKSLARAFPGPGWIWLAVPAIGMALLAWVLEAPSRPALTGSAATFGAPSGKRAASQTSARARAALARTLEQGPAERNDPVLRTELLAELDSAIDGLERERDGSGSTGELTQQLAATRADLVGGTPAGSPQGANPKTAPTGASPAPQAGPGDGSPGDGRKSLLTNGSADRTMAGSNRSTAALDGARLPPKGPDTGSSGEAGTLAGRWWPERYDPVVQGWRRALAARRQQH